MKIARIVLTATMLLSLKSTLFCSSQGSENSIKLERKDSFDALRDRAGYRKVFFSSFIGYNNKALIAYTCEHLGEEYQGKEIRPGSDEEAIDAWKKEIKTVQDAQTFLERTELHKAMIAIAYYEHCSQIINKDSLEAKFPQSYSAAVTQSDENFVANDITTSSTLTEVTQQPRNKRYQNKHKPLRL